MVIQTMYEFIDNINKEEYENFILSCPYNHFMQSYDFGQIRKYKHFIPHYVGLKKDGKLVCAALLLEKKLKLGYTYFYSPRGYILDYNNLDLIEAFTNELKKYAKKNKAIFIKMDPAIKRHNLDQDGNIIDDNNNYKLINYLKKLGYKHQGYNIGFEHEQPRFTFRISLDGSWDEIYSRIHPTSRKILNKGNQYNLEIYKGNTHKDLEDFYDTMIETSKREGIIQSPIDYYETFFNIFNYDNLSDLYIVKVKMSTLINSFENKIKNVENEIETINSRGNSKNDNKVNDLVNQLNKLNKDLEEIKEIKDDELILSSIITVKYGDKVWTVHGGNNSKLLNLNANYLCYFEIMKDAYNEGYKVMDCFGTCGIPNPDKSNPIFGIHSFKKRLGGEYTEFIGEFDLVTNKFMYFIFKKLIPIRRRIVRSILRRKEKRVD